ncbi:MAG TPA: tripartite tricarboxylate transporter permease, partial [Afifellaceae bacterium]|nr:tripartite tricarboxylate transporter permease [Afifellaceae bacterium]
MEAGLLDMALSAAAIMADPVRLSFLALGVVVGLALGVIPGLGGLVGLSLLLPFTFNLDAYSAIAMLIGVSSVVTTSDTIPAVLFGVPGTVGSAATILDGHPMARQGKAGRAFGAAFMASMLGGLFGALLLGLSVPVLRPVMLAIGTPELLSFCVFGLSLVAVLSGNNAFKGLAAACFGLLLATIGEDSQAGVMRWTFGTIYLWDGLHIVPLALGLFAIPELADLAIRRSSIAGEAGSHRPKGQMAGVSDVFRHGFLVLRCSSIGSLLGSVPGIGSAVIDWVAYGHAARTEKGAGESFGKGDVRGVIASESSNNAKEGGALVPTIAFGVPGSASMALLIGAFAVHGIVPGPAMLNERLDVTYSMVWSVALANILGAGICFLFANQLARLALVRAGILVPMVLAVTYIGAFQGTNDWGDLYVLIGAGALGFVMKRLKWPRPPVILGFVLGAIVERYMFISFNLYGLQWMARPVVLIVLVASLYGVLAPTVRRLISSPKSGPRGVRFALRADVNIHDILFTAAFGAVFAAALAISWQWPLGARFVPQIISWTGIAAIAILIALQLFLKIDEPSTPGAADNLHLD